MRKHAWIGLVCWLVIFAFVVQAQAALTFSNNKRIDPKYTGKFKVGSISVACDTYGSTGWAVTPSNLGLTGIISLTPQAVAGAGYILAAHVASATSATVFAYETDADAGADIGLTAIDDGDLTGATFKMDYMGY